MSEGANWPLAVKQVTGIIAASLALFTRREDEAADTFVAGYVSDFYQSVAWRLASPGSGAGGGRSKVNDQAAAGRGSSAFSGTSSSSLPSSDTSFGWLLTRVFWKTLPRWFRIVATRALLRSAIPLMQALLRKVQSAPTRVHARCVKRRTRP